MDELEKLLSGKSLNEITKCDANVPDIHETVRILENMFYIVAAVVVDDRGHVLMTQEAKPSCYGKWYLPAGKLEPNETIEQGVVREIKEETGYDFSPTTLLCVEECGGKWVRFTMAGNIIGGSIKTLNESDEESLQANWWDPNTPLSLRSNDILYLVDIGLNYHNELRVKRLSPLLPVQQPHSSFSIRLIFIHQMSSTKDYDEVHVLNKNGTTVDNLHIPTAHVGQTDLSVHPAIQSILRSALEDEISNYAVEGVVGIEHCGNTNMCKDGLCLNIVASFCGESLPTLQSTSYTWNAVCRTSKVHVDIQNILNGNTQSSIVPLLSRKVMKTSK